MKNFYYFSSRKLKFVEIKSFQRKLILTIGLASLAASLLFLLLFVQFTNRTDVEYLQQENEKLVTKLESLLDDYKNLEDKTKVLSEKNNLVRMNVNLSTVTPEEQKIGIGGKAFGEIIPLTTPKANLIVDSLKIKFENLTAKLNFEKNNLNQISERLIYNEDFFRHIPAIKPVDAALGDRFGMRLHPILKIRRMHHGQDLRAKTGTKVFCPGDGVVSSVSWRGGYGRTIVVDHGFGYKTVYAHLLRYKVAVGDTVKRGDLLALTGSSGKFSTGPHLHYEVRYNGVTQNPKDYFYEDLSPQEYNLLAQKAAK